MTLVLPESLRDVEAVTRVATPARLEYDFTAGRATTTFLRGILEHKILGEACPICHKVYVPSRGACPSHGVPTSEIVELAGPGVLVSYCVVNVAFHGSVMELPYVGGLIQLEGADMFLMHLIQEASPDEVRIGQWVEPVWRDDADLEATLESIRYFRPLDRPDATVDEAGHVVSWGPATRGGAA
ncbi:MAG: Zn-ribbon domain-containing OB-fold protein [Actinobacteria bacterium]|nr:Zn-ribbon domain-containing OB-fold protein [Actinomycetota bacterium]